MDDFSHDISSKIAELEKSECDYSTSFFATVTNFETPQQCVRDFTFDHLSELRDSETFGRIFSVAVYPNGDCEENEGYISVFFNFHQALVNFKINWFSLSAVVSVADNEENPRYFQSFAANHDLQKEWNNLEGAHHRMGLERYLERTTILNSNDFLRDGSLTIKFDVVFLFDPSPKKANMFRELFHEQEKKEGWMIREEKVLPPMLQRFGASKKMANHSLNFSNENSSLIRSLKRKSGYFEKLFETSLDECKKKLLKIKLEEYEAFFSMLCYVHFDTLNHVYNAEEYFDLYVVSDKYEIADLKQRCSEYIQYSTTPSTAAEILFISDLCNDRRLKSSVMKYILENKYDVIKSEGWKWLMKEQKYLAREVIPTDEEFLPVERAQLDWFDSKNYLRIKRNLVSSDFSAQRPQNSLYSGGRAPVVQSCPTVQREVKPKIVNINDLQERINVNHDEQTFFECATDVSSFEFYT